MPGVKSIVTQPNAILINGYGSYYNSTSGTHKFAPMAVFYVQRGKKHRFRIIDVGSHVCQFLIKVRTLYLLFLLLSDQQLLCIIAVLLLLLVGY